ncbi:MAG TPA: acyl-CoA dehydrogenase family protein, partial [Bacillota bacterium]|nr:acyl-CoA dehydrogenase family protein [Bacillota bacterium]
MSELPKGGGFLFSATDPMSIFTVEDFNEEHKLVYQTARKFMDDKILPRLEEWDNDKMMNKEVALLAGELGLLGTDAPEEYGGYAMDKICTTIVAENMGRSGSMCMFHGGQTGIGQLPLVFFGTHEQRAKYLPGVVAGKTIIAYALTEPGAGSDALAAKTWARLSEDGKHYVLNGTKQFISNAGFADHFIVFAKVDREKFTCFIVDANTEGLSTGPEEHKMGLKGSSTRTVILEDVKVPVENLLFEVGKGHVVAFNILNMGRVKIAANCIGMGKLALELSVQFANDRKQFGKSISEFGLIKEKLASMAARIYALESMVYRTGGMIEEILHIQPNYPILVGQDSANAIE